MWLSKVISIFIIRNVFSFQDINQKSSGTKENTSCFKLTILCVCLLFNVNSAIFQLYHGVNKLNFNEMMMRAVETLQEESFKMKYVRNYLLFHVSSIRSKIQ
jgi:hypothetical protein